MLSALHVLPGFLLLLEQFQEFNSQIHCAIMSLTVQFFVCLSDMAAVPSPDISVGTQMRTVVWFYWKLGKPVDTMESDLFTVFAGAALKKSQIYLLIKQF